MPPLVVIEGSSVPGSLPECRACPATEYARKLELRWQADVQTILALRAEIRRLGGDASKPTGVAA